MIKYVLAYLIGGLTPFVVGAIVFLSSPVESAPAVKPSPEEEVRKYKQKLENEGVSKLGASSWVFVSQFHVNINESGEVESIAKPPADSSARGALMKHIAAANASATASTTPSSKSVPEDAVVPKSLNKLPKYWGSVEDHQFLLFESQPSVSRNRGGSAMSVKQDDPAVVVDLRTHIVTLWPPGGEDFELFYKKYAICLIPRSSVVTLDIAPDSPPQHSYFVYVDNGFNKENLYFSLIAASRGEPDPALGPRDPAIMAQPIIASEKERLALITRVYSVHEPVQTQWLNALLGRLFLAVKESKMIEEYYKDKIVYKLSRTKPSFIGDINVADLDCGLSMPYFTDFQLIELDAQGHLTLAANIVYSGGFFAKLATTAQISIPGFKTRSVGLNLAVTLKSLEGRLLVKMNPAPSSRIWYAFETMPEMDLLIEPVVSQRQFNYGLITRAISSAIQDAIKESMVMPFMDDITFYDSSGEFYRGGIWDYHMRPESTAKWHGVNSKKPETKAEEAELENARAKKTVTTTSIDTGKSKGDNEGTTEHEFSDTASTTSSRWKNWSSVLRRKTTSVGSDGHQSDTATFDEDNSAETASIGSTVSSSVKTVEGRSKLRSDSDASVTFYNASAHRPVRKSTLPSSTPLSDVTREADREISPYINAPIRSDTALPAGKSGSVEHPSNSSELPAPSSPTSQSQSGVQRKPVPSSSRSVTSNLSPLSMRATDSNPQPEGLAAASAMPLPQFPVRRPVPAAAASSITVNAEMGIPRQRSDSSAPSIRSMRSVSSLRSISASIPAPALATAVEAKPDFFDGTTQGDSTSISSGVPHHGAAHHLLEQVSETSSIRSHRSHQSAATAHLRETISGNTTEAPPPVPPRRRRLVSLASVAPEPELL